MKVHELIKLLQEFNDDTIIVVSDNDGHYNSIESLIEEDLIKSDYEYDQGEYISMDYINDYEDPEIIMCITINT
jgi:hypothetical protein